MTDEEGPLTRAEFALVQDSLQLILRIATTTPALSLRNLDRFIRQSEYADTLGPFLDPTLWMQGKDKLDAMTEDAKALRSLIKGVLSRHPEIPRASV